MGNLTEHFSRYEFRCRCGADGIMPIVYESLEKLREAYGRPIIISSGFRCKEHNRVVGGAQDSSHLKGLAADFKYPHSTDLDRLLEIMYGLVDDSGERIFNRIGIYADGHIHVDFDSSKVNHVTWVS